MGEPMKFSFGFSKISKKTALVPQRPLESVEYIKCVEDNTVKLVNEELNKAKPLPVIPMPPGSSVRDRILEAVKAREATKGKTDENGSGDVAAGESTEVKQLSLEEMAAKELMEGQLESEEKKPDLVINAVAAAANREMSTLDDYENMPIGDYGLAMLRGMGWEPTKGIGLNEKVVTPVAPQVRVKGMGLGADKALAAQKNSDKTSEELILKKSSTVKVISGPHNQLYGKVEAFEELPGRILVRLALSNAVVSLSEFMVQLVNSGEYNKNAKVMNLDQYNAAIESESKVENKHYVKRDAPVVKHERRRSRSPIDKYSNKRHSSRKHQKEDRKHKYNRSDSSDSADKHRRNTSPDRRHKIKKKSKSKYTSSSDSDFREKHRQKSKHKKKSYKNDSDSDSSRDKYRKKKEKRRR